MFKKNTLAILFTASLFISLTLTGCKSASKLLHKVIEPQSYSHKVSDTLNKCQFDKSMKEIQSIKVDTLRNSELGLLKHFKYAHKESNAYLTKAIQEYRRNNKKAIFDISSFLKREYRTEGYEKILLHNYKAINYLLLGDFEATRVEAKNSNMIQRMERKKLNKFKNENSNNNSNKILLTRYDKLFMNVNARHSPYQNPFAYYISALAYAEDKDYDNAIIDIRKALTLLPNSEILEEKLLLYKKRENTNKLEIFFDIGQSPLKSQVALKVDIGNNNQRVIYFPSFTLSISEIETINIVDSQGDIIATSSILVDINAIKINEFKEKLPAVISVIMRQASISLASGVLNKDSEVMASLFKTASAVYSQYNRRTWSLLPQKTLVISFTPKRDKRYFMQLISKNGKILEKKSLNINYQEKYKHFSIKNSEFCISHKEQIN